MQPVAVPSSVNVATPQPSSAGGGVQGALADLLRAGGAGMASASRQTALAGDKAAIHPFESVITLTSLLKDKTAKVNGLNRATSTLNTIAGFAMLILAGNATGSIKAAGASYQDLAQRVADAIDGKKTADGWASNWGFMTDASGGAAQLAPSGIGTALAQLGVR